MKLDHIGNYKFSPTKTFSVYQSGENYYFAKQAPLSSYETLMQIAELSKTNKHLARIGYFQKQEDKLIYLTKIYQGASLEKLVKTKKIISKEYLYQIIAQICSGLKTLHSQGIIHRDIKPANILLVNDEVVIIDYDISRKYQQDKYSDTTYLGTKFYASPEQYGFNQTTVKSDIFSLGKTIEVLVKHCLKEEDKEYLYPLIKKATALDPKDRFNSIDEIISYLSENQLVAEQIYQIKQLKAHNVSEWIIDDIYQHNYNDSQIGVIKHAINEQVSDNILKLILNDDLTSRQMWQIKEGYNNQLDYNHIKVYAKPCYSAEEMALCRNLMLKDVDIVEIYERIKNYNYIIQSCQINSDQLIVVRNFFIYLNDCNLIYNLIKTNKYWVDEVNRLLKPLRSKEKTKILR